MPKASEILRDRVVEAAWSLWTGLGVPGRLDFHGEVAVDPEPLVVLTAALGDADPRLRDEATDWCIRYGAALSGSRLKNLVAKRDERVRERFGGFAATIAAHSSIRWPGATGAQRFKPRPRPRNGAFDRPSQVALRLRALVGVGARADVLLSFLAQPGIAFSAADLAVETNYSKRNIAQVLESMRLGGFVVAFSVRNQIRYRLPGALVDQLIGQLSPMPRAFPRWTPIFRILASGIELLKEIEKSRGSTRAIEARAFAAAHREDIRTSRLPPPRPVAPGSDFSSELVSWLLVAVDNLAAGNDPAEDRFKARWVPKDGMTSELAMARGHFRVWEAPGSRSSGARWAIGLIGKSGDIDEGVRYATAEDAKKSAELKQLSLDRTGIAARIAAV